MNELSNFTDNLPTAIGKFESKGILTDAELCQLFDVVKHGTNDPNNSREGKVLH